MRVLTHQTLGNGPKLTFLLHGFLGSGRNLRSLARRWCEREASRTLVLPDLTGHGQSPGLPFGADLASLADDVVDLALYLGVDGPFSMVGHSLGGRVALQARAHNPELVSEVVLLDISPGSAAGRAPGLAHMLQSLLAAPTRAASRSAMGSHLEATGLPRDLVDWLLLNLERHDDAVRWRIDRGALAALHRRIEGADQWPAVADDPGCVTLIRGDRSSLVTEADARRLAELGATVHTLAGAGHFVHLDAPAALLDLLTQPTRPPQA